MKTQLRHLCPLFFVLFFSTLLYSQNPAVIINNPNSSRLEIKNGLVGLVVPKESSFNTSAPQYTLAPIQAIIYANGAYSDNSDNYIESLVPPTSLKVTITKETSEECIIVIKYTFNKPSFNNTGYGTFEGGDAGVGYCLTTISLKKGAKTAVVEVESDYDISYTFKIGNGLDPDKARYRGYSSNSVVDGYEPSGITYRPEHERGSALDATVDLNYSNEKYFPFLSFWEQAGGEVNTGRYWQLFNSGASQDANLLGFFQGRASRLLGNKNIGVRLVIKSDKATNRMASFANIALKRRADDNSWSPTKRFQFGIFVSKKTDLLNANEYQPIGKEMNVVSGLAAKIDAYANNSAVINPSFFEGALYLKPAKIQALISQIKTDQAFYNKVIAMDPYFTPIADAWRFKDAATATINSIINFGEDLKNIHKNKDGIYNFNTRYWKGSFEYKRIASQVSCLFADKSILITAGQKEALLGVVRMLARICWDDDNVPLYDGAGVDLGPANMAYMYRGARNFFALIFNNDPDFQERANKVLEGTRKDILSGIYKNGSTFGTPHYTQATVDPILFSMLQLKQAGVGNLFQEEKERITRFTDFYSSLLTPPSARFKNYRKLISFGDGSEESAVSFALIASGLEDIDPALSKRLYSNFQNGSSRLSMFGYVAISVDLTQEYLPDYHSTSSNFEGYLSHLRSGINTNNETAAWIINGDMYYDHRNDDAGEIAMYALKAPVSLSRSSFYYPHAPDARIRSVVVPESIFPQWNSSNQPISSHSKTWKTSNQQEFAKLGNSTVSTSKMTADGDWFRKVVMLTLKEDQPVIILYDSLTNNNPAIWSMPFMSKGAVVTPAGNVTPVDRLYDRNNSSQQLPEATSENGFSKGLNKFSFTGQDWPKSVHPTGGINWHLYNVSKAPGSFTMSQWTTNWQNDLERSEYRETTGEEYKETQQFLRIKNTEPTLNILLPYFKGTDTYKNELQLVTAGKILIPYGNGKLFVTANSYYYSDSEKSIAATLSSLPFNEDGIAIEGGVAEVEINNTLIKIRVHGNNGNRKITLPFSAELMVQRNDITVTSVANSTEVNINYVNNDKNLLSTEQGYTEFLLVKKAVSSVCTGVNITADITSGKILCNGASTTLTANSVTGGLAPYTFSVNGGGFMSAAVFNSFAVTAGTYIVVVKDSSSCLSNAINVNVTSSNPPININVEAPVCENATGRILVSATGGGGQFRFTLNGSSNTTGLTTGIFTSVENGNYTVTATDILGCNKTSSQVTVNCTVNPPPSACTGVSISANITAGSLLCGNTTTTLSANNISGGVSPYTFSINGGFFISNSSFNSFAIPHGSHTVIIKDANGCMSNAIIVIIASPKPALVLNVAPACENSIGGITATATGGTALLRFKLNGSENSTGNTTGIYTNIAKGFYTITVTDSLGCTKTSNEIVIDCTPPPTMQAH